MAKVGKRTLLDVRDISDIKDLITGTVKTHGDRIAFLTKENGEYKGTTYRELFRDLNNYGTAMMREGFQNERIAVVGENSYYWVLTYLCGMCGLGVMVPIDKELPGEEIATLLNAADASIVVYSDKMAEKIEPILPMVPTLKKSIVMQKDIPELCKKGQLFVDEGDTSYIDAEIDPEAMAEILFTSGTTGTPKGVMLCQRNIAKNLMGMCSMTYMDHNDRFLSVLPINHTYECTCGILCPLYRGASVAFCEGLRYIAKNLQESHATIMLGVPLIVENMYRKIWQGAKKAGMEDKLKKAIKLNNATKKIGIDMSDKLFRSVRESVGEDFRMFVCGAAALDPAAAQGLQDLGFMIIQGYGLTECAPIGALHYENRIKNDSCGEAVARGGELRILDPDAQGIGEILIKSPGVMMGYYNNPEATKEVLDEDGWFHSGDLGYLDEDDCLHIAGRKKNVIVAKNGKNVFPEEIETYLSRVPYVAECMVYGKKNEKDDEEIRAQIIVNDDAIKEALGASYTEEDVHALLQKEITAINERIPLYKHIDNFSIRTEPFHKTTTAKIKRHLEEKK